MDLEEQDGVETAGTRCEVCGVELTADEQRDTLAGGPVLCKMHAAEQLPATGDESAGPPPAA